MSPHASSNQPIKILDSVGPAAASSGKAGALITNRPPLKRGNASDKRQSLFEKSFELHESLAEELKLESFCPVQNYQVVNELSDKTDEDRYQQQTNCAKLPLCLSNLENTHAGVELPGDAAIIDPAELTYALFNQALARNNDSSFLKATVRGLKLVDDNQTLQRILVEPGKGDCEIDYINIEKDEPVVIALGSWSASIEDWLGIPMPIEGVVSTSMLYNNGIPSSDIGTALFLDSDLNGCHLELFGRKDRSLYVSGCGESDVIGTEVLRGEGRPSPEICPPNMARAAAAQKSLKKLGYKECTPDIVQACMRPMSPDAIPVVGKILSNVYVATGGGPWGITWGPLMGKCIESLINDDDLPIRMAPLKPQRYDTLLYRTLLNSRSPNKK
ncbi:unnamed protein product [Cylindrotheca closterium]|uniref:FAD dependent oxidoreductase domain-containing protein n=1 Tax=Cylindrotheca closterium TaxID=2856 RepID=A0AAD2G0C8_9STRA|nr:unnamed protein product [Cylindrotheca closterium]